MLSKLNQFISRIVLIIFVLLYWNTSFSQSKAAIDKINERSYDKIVSDVKESITLFQKNANDAHAINYSQGEAYSYGKLALAQYIAGEIDNSTDSYLKAIKLHKKDGNIKEVSGLYSEFGYSLKRYDMSRSKYYMRKAIQIAEQKNYKIELTNHYNNFGVVHEIDNNLDSAVYYYNKALSNAKRNKDNIGIPYCYENLSGAYAILKNYNRAHKFLDSASVYREKEKGAFGRVENLSARANLYYKENKIREAIDTYLIVKKNAKSLNYNSMILNTSDALSKAYEDVDIIDSALLYAREFKTLSDSLNTVEREKELLELEVEFNATEKDKEIAEKKLKLKNLQLQVLTISSIAIILLIVTFLIWKSQKSKRLRQKLESESKIKHEKIRISRELHDNIGSRLTFIIGSIENTSHQVSENQKNALDDVSKFGRNTLQDLRTTVWAMKNETGNLEEFVLRINELKKSISGSISFEVNNSADTNYPFSATELLNLYRITQEFIQNSIKHSSADTIQLNILKQEESLIFELIDNGKGFEKSNTHSGSGIQNIQARIEQMNGIYEMRTTDGVVLTIKLRHKTY